MAKEKDTYSYVGWLQSDSLIKRSMAVIGYNFLGGLIIYAIVFLFGFILMGIGGAFM